MQIMKSLSFIEKYIMEKAWKCVKNCVYQTLYPTFNSGA